MGAMCCCYVSTAARCGKPDWLDPRNGRDTHIRQIKVRGRATMGRAGLMDDSLSFGFAVYEPMNDPPKRNFGKP